MELTEQEWSENYTDCSAHPEFPAKDHTECELRLFHQLDQLYLLSYSIYLLSYSILYNDLSIYSISILFIY